MSDDGTLNTGASLRDRATHERSQSSLSAPTVDIPSAMPRLNLCKSTCEVRDERWAIHIDAGDEPCGVSVKHRRFGDYYDWPDAVFANGGGGCAAADRAYVMQDESSFRSRSAALTAARDFLRRFGAGEIEYLEWDVDSQSMVVVGHSPRWRMAGWHRHSDDKPDPIAPFYASGTEARRVETGTGSVHDGPVAESETPTRPHHPPEGE